MISSENLETQCKSENLQKEIKYLDKLSRRSALILAQYSTEGEDCSIRVQKFLCLDKCVLKT